MTIRISVLNDAQEYDPVCSLSLDDGEVAARLLDSDLDDDEKSGIVNELLNTPIPVPGAPPVFSYTDPGTWLDGFTSHFGRSYALLVEEDGDDGVAMSAGPTPDRTLWAAGVVGDCLLEANGDLQAALQAASFILATQPPPSGVALGMVNGEWRGPNPPGKGWSPAEPGPRGGKRWRRDGSVSSKGRGGGTKTARGGRAPSPEVVAAQGVLAKMVRGDEITADELKHYAAHADKMTAADLRGALRQMRARGYSRLAKAALQSEVIKNYKPKQAGTMQTERTKATPREFIKSLIDTGELKPDVGRAHLDDLVSARGDGPMSPEEQGKWIAKQRTKRKQIHSETYDKTVKTKDFLKALVDLGEIKPHIAEAYAEELPNTMSPAEQKKFRNRRSK